ncbi:tetratricopeptide repeat protein [Schlesneria paludicola]|uniref:tetratricopeptide repeat protein n=1 Tax=Schlesneria paludicola TaxID=360056 RepID=UPI0002D5FBC4|nr:tetratricopeptide repeat protein [Schlesneria paludicola]
MNRKLWKTVAILGLAISTPLFAFARGGGGGGGGGHGGGGGGGGGHAGGGGGHVGGGGGGGHIGGGGGGQPGGNFGGGGGGVVRGGGGQPGGNFGGGGRPAITQPGVGGHPGMSHGNNLGGVRNNFQPGVTNTFRSNNPVNGVGAHPGFNQAGQTGLNRSNLGVGQHPGLNQSNINQNISNRNNFSSRNNYAGNNVNFGNRSYNFANNGYRPSFYNHPGHYQGYWNGNRFGGYGGYGGYGAGYRGLGYGGYGGGWGLGYGGYGYGYRPLGWGLAGWGLGSLLYNSGYLGYYNPYYASGYGNYGSGSSYSYAQPIPVAYNVDDTQTTVAGDGQSADDILNAAISSFKQNDYDTALATINSGVSKYPSDSVMHEFRGLVLFAKGDFPQAAATLHSVLAVGPGWNWTTLSSLYSDVAVYTTQLRALEAAVKNRPDDAAQRFVLAYHYLSDGYPDSAAKQLQEVVRLVPNDRVASDMLKMVSAPQATSTDQTGQAAGQPTPEPPAAPTAIPAGGLPSPANPSAKPIDPSAVVGVWKATRDDGSSFELKLGSDKMFTWKFSGKQQAGQSFDGTYTIDGNVLSLERKGGGSMLAEIVSNDAQHFTFKPVGAPPEDPGLNFSK